MAVAIDFADIQGDILRAYGNRYDRTSYVFVAGRRRRSTAARGCAGSLDQVTTAGRGTATSRLTTLNVALTTAGLAALGVGPARRRHASRRSSATGMAGRARQLGDIGASDSGQVGEPVSAPATPTCW